MNHRIRRLDRPMVKYGVRTALTGNVFRAFIACLIPTVLSLVLNLLPSDSGVLYFQISEPLLYGISGLSWALSLLLGVFVTDPINVRLAGYFLRLTRDPANLPSPLTVCDCFDTGYLRLVRGMLLRQLSITIWAAVPLIIGGLLPGSLSIVTVEGIRAVSIGGVFPYCVIISAGLVVYRELCYTMVPYVLIDQPELTAREALRESVTLTRGRLWELFVLDLSFLGWLLLLPVTLFLGAIYVLPYMAGVQAAYYDGFQEALYGGRNNAA